MRDFYVFVQALVGSELLLILLRLCLRFAAASQVWILKLFEKSVSFMCHNSG